MISKHIPANSFYHTCRYISNKPGSELLIAEGVRDYDFKLMAVDFQTQQQVRPEKKQACFHSILSFYPGEKPSDELMKEISLKYLKELGIVNTQYAVTKHTDKAHLHLHIVANMVNNEGMAISDSWIGLKGKKIAQRLTKEYQLIPAIQKNMQLANLEALSQSEANKYKIYMAISDNLPHCLTLEDLEIRLLNLGIATQYKYKGQTKEKQGVSFKLENVSFKGSQVDREFSIKGLEKTLALQQKQILEHQVRTENKLQFKENHAGRKPPVDQIRKSNSLPESEKEVSQDITTGIGKAIEILLMAEQTDSQMSYGFSQQALLKKRKRKSRHISR